MLYHSFLRRALSFHLTASTFRSFTTSAAALTSPESFRLDRNIFNETLYSSIRDVWFAHLPPGAAAMNKASQQQWYGVNQTQHQALAFDKHCYDQFGHALEAVAPQKYALPVFESFEHDVEQAATNSKPFLDEVTGAQQAGDEKQAADTLLSLVLLLDQISRNIHRDQAGLRLVFQHYDRISFALLHASLKLQPRPVDAEEYRLRPAVKQFFVMPFMHCEHIPSHDVYMDIMTGCKKAVGAAKVQEALDQLEITLGFEEKHQVPLRKFGRYPHRNEALGRKNTPEEAEYLKTGATFGVAQGGKKDLNRDTEKSEL